VLTVIATLLGMTNVANFRRRRISHSTSMLALLISRRISA
jgi:hypothetical protein